MSATLTDALVFLRPGAHWNALGGTYEGIDWLDQVQTKPTQQEIADAIVTLDAAKASEATRQSGIKNEPDRVDMLNRLKTATPAQIDTWVDSNVTNIASARTVLKAIIKVIALDQRD